MFVIVYGDIINLLRHKVYTFHDDTLVLTNGRQPNVQKDLKKIKLKILFYRTMKSHSWLILLVVLCTTQVHAKPPSSTEKEVEEIPTTKATNILKTSVTEDLR